MKTVSIIIPAYNEEKTIIQMLKRVNAVNLSTLGFKKEILVINDGSTDSTEALLRKHSSLYTRLISKENGGKGSAVRRGLLESTGDIVLIQDADLEYFPEDYPRLLLPILHKRTRVVYGSRFKGATAGKNKVLTIKTHYLGNKLLSLATSLLYFRYISDMETCYKCFTREVLLTLRLKENDFRIEPEITTQIIKNKFKILEVPIRYNPRTFSEGKKINWKDGLRALWYLIKQRFVPKEEFLEQYLRQKRTNKIMRFIGKEKTVLDVGCGFSGKFLRSIEPRIKKGVGLDKKVAKLKTKKIELKTTMLDDTLEIKSQQFEVVTLLAVLEHLEKPAAIVREAHRVLKKNGRFIVTTPSPPSKPLLELMAFFNIVSKEEIADHKHYFSKKELVQLFKENSFKVAAVGSFEFGLNNYICGIKI